MTVEGKKKFSLLRSSPESLSPFNLEACRVGRGISVVVCGTLGVEEFSESAVLLRVSGMRIKIVGRALCLSIYENKTVEIIGNVSSTEYIYDKYR